MHTIPDIDVPGSTLEPGDLVPDFDLAASLGRRVSRDGFKGRPFVMYFYPKADTSGCTRQACDFEQALAALNDAGAKAGLALVGVSRDPLKAIDRFAAKYTLTFPLASDADGTVVEAYGVWTEKSMYGRTYMGIDRSTFLVDGEGRLVRSWRKVKVPGHVADVLKAAAAL
ncbi:peroxiredoxin [Lichenicola cladoniae]|uniref:thioredoxin-dependent peroxiredoxin n=1 Tax=Lichenicola cladoniae TaxID=1484109 RepID=A0A6M8HM99_9PROT|nr:peroxiredoxin [Lichenicola cladoniae]NPD66931.1 peroxiredoxin [Acetobacteraceae bacterium]QKE89485.1 peroxiredoxin [Lichenicola cladoniae]